MTDIVERLRKNPDMCPEATYWMDDEGRVCTADFMRSEKAHGDYQLVYNIPCVKKGGRFVKLTTAIGGK
jgi:hypothetical protein